MTHLHLRKLTTLTFSYGWLGVLYGSLFSFIPQEFGYTLSPLINGIILIITITLTVAWSYRIEMRMYTPSFKFWTIIALGFVGMVVGAKAPLLYPIFYLMLMAALEYPCRDCVTFTRIHQ